MGVDGCHRAMKYVLIVFNVLVLLVGVAAIVLGVLALTSDYGAEEMKDITGSNLYLGGCIVIIVGGSIIVLISFLGCCGSFMENRVMLGIYFVVMLLFLVLFVVAACVGFFFMDELEEELEEEMTKTLMDKYGEPDYESVTDVWDKVQEELECCGVNGEVDSSTSWFIWQSSAWFRDEGDQTKYVPLSCCNLDGSSGNSTQCQERNNNLSMPPQPSTMTVNMSNPNMYGQGCVDSLKDKIEENIVAVAVIAVIVLIILLMSVIFSVCVCVEIGRNKQLVV